MNVLLTPVRMVPRARINSTASFATVPQAGRETYAAMVRIALYVLWLKAALSTSARIVATSCHCFLHHLKLYSREPGNLSHPHVPTFRVGRQVLTTDTVASLCRCRRVPQQSMPKWWHLYQWLRDQSVCLHMPLHIYWQYV